MWWIAIIVIFVIRGLYRSGYCSFCGIAWYDKFPCGICGEVSGSFGEIFRAFFWGKCKRDHSV